jgi:hypothetical protein
MIAEISVFGVYLSGALATACVAGVALLVVRRFFLWVGFYRFVWHRHLVDLALFTILWATVVMVMPPVAEAIGGAW